MDNPAPCNLLISCEHGGNRIPKRYRHLFAGAEGTLASHRGLDIGAATLARRMSRILDAPLFLHGYSRLLADANRRPGSPTLFSEFTRGLDPIEKQRILKKFHAPYRIDVEDRVREEISGGAAVLHLSIHSFTPVLKGTVRSGDIGFLYDPKRICERAITNHLMDAFRKSSPDLKYRRNYPYRGVSESLTTSLRQKFTEDCYAGIEIEVNQRFVQGKPDDWRSFQTCFLRTFQDALISLPLPWP